MRTVLSPLKKLLALLPLTAVCFHAQASNQTTPERVYEIATRVADWQIDTFEEQGKYRAVPVNNKKWNHRNKHHELAWTNAALYVGMYEWSKVASSDKYAQWLTSIGERNDWKLYDRPYHADDHTVGQLYLNLYRESGDAKMIEPTETHFDWILKNPRTGTLLWNAEPTDALHRWGWCDALFMAPPVWARLAAVTGEQKYLDFMDQEYHETYDLLWDKEEHLFWRDSSFFGRTEENGRKIFWSRGNGWVFGGLALMIPDLPEDWKGREFYIELYHQMAVKLKEIQRADGTWSMGLLGSVTDYPNKETSGTSFYTFGLAWGINHGLLDADEYTPVVLKAFEALRKCVKEDGLLGWVQPIGAAPGESFEDFSEVYGVGAFLAASAEVYKLVGGTVPHAVDSGN